MQKFAALLLFLVLLFSGCGSKRVYEPKVETKSWDKYGDIDEEIVQVSKNASLLENMEVLTKTDHLKIKLEDEYSILGLADGWVLSATLDGKVKMQYLEDDDIVEDFSFGKTIATASVKDNILAVLFADNEIALYEVDSKKLLYKEELGQVLAVDERIMPPLFKRGLVIFSSLNGKIVVVHVRDKKRLRTTTVSVEDNFNNILYLKIINNKIIAATANRILSLAQYENKKRYDIRDVADSNENIFITTKQGEVISLNSDLDEYARLKFPFAHFIGMIAKNNKVYLLEKEGYMIVADSTLSKYDVYDVDVNDGKLFVTDDKFYTEDEYILVE